MLESKFFVFINFLDTFFFILAARNDINHVFVVATVKIGFRVFQVRILYIKIIVFFT